MAQVSPEKLGAILMSSFNNPQPTTFALTSLHLVLVLVL
jgi:hypothetical protein